MSINLGNGPAAVNPANIPAKQKEERARIPMNLPVQRLAVPDIPGYVLRWMRGDAVRIQRALRAGYEFVAPDEVDLNNFGISNGQNDSGNQDLGSRVSHIGGTGESGDVEMLYLMKLREEYHQADLAEKAKRQEQQAAVLRGDKGFSGAGDDASNRYVGAQTRNTQRNLFLPKH